MSEPTLDPRTLGLLVAQLKDALKEKGDTPSMDSRGRGGEHDAWLVDWHLSCPNVDLVANAGRLYHWCPEHRCFALVCYETCRRSTFEHTAQLEHELPAKELLAERVKRARMVGGEK